MEGGLDSLFLTEYDQLGWEQTDSALWEPEPLVDGRIPALPSPPKLSLNLEAFGIPDADFPLLTIPLYTSTADSSHLSAGEGLDAEGATSSLAAVGAEGRVFDEKKKVACNVIYPLFDVEFSYKRLEYIGLAFVALQSSSMSVKSCFLAILAFHSQLIRQVQPSLSLQVQGGASALSLAKKWRTVLCRLNRKTRKRK